MARKKNLALEEAELAKIEELNERKKKALKEQAELLRQEQDLAGGEEKEETAEPSIISDDLMSVIQGLEDDDKFWVYRLDESGKAAQCGTYPLSDWPDRLEEIARKAGGGTFRISFRNSRGHPIKQTTKTFDTKFYAGPPPAPAANGSGDIVALMLAQAQEARREAAEARQANADLMKTVLSALMQPKDTGFLKNASDIALIGELFKGKGGGGDIEMFKLGLDIGRDSKVEAEPSSPLEKLLEKIGEPAGKLLERMTAAPRAVRPAPANVPAAIEAVSAAKAPEPAPAPPDPVKSHPFYGKYVPEILAAARKNEDPKEWAEMVTDLFPAVYHDALLSLLQKPDLVEVLGQYEPEARNYAAWITSVRNEILALFPAEDAPLQAEPVGSTAFVKAPEGAEMPPALAQAIAE